MDLSHPLVESVLFPLTTALVLAGAIRWGLGARIGTRLAASAVGIALLVALVLILGEPVWPARTGLQKLPLTFAGLLAAGVAIDAIDLRRNGILAAGTVAVAIIALWLGWPQLSRGDPAAVLLTVAAALLALAALAGLLGASATGVSRPSMIVMATLGLAGASLNAGSLVLFQLALAVAAAVAGFALWSWPKPRLPFAAAGLLVAGIGSFAIALLTLLLTEIRPWALLPVALVFLGDAVARRLPVPRRFPRTTVEPLYILAIGSVFALAAVYLALAPSSVDDIYYR